MNSVQKARTGDGPQKVELCRKGLVFRKAWGSANDGNVTLRMAASKSPFSQGRYSVVVDVVKPEENNQDSIIEPVGRLREGPVELPLPRGASTLPRGASNIEFIDTNWNTVSRTEASGSLPEVLAALMRYPETHSMIDVVKEVSRLVKDSVRTV